MDRSAPAVSQRMTAVQTPIIPVVADWLRAHPGTISLGQGVVHYPPPSQAVDRIPSFLANPANHKYQAVAGLPELVAALTAKLKAENRIEAAGLDVVVTAGGNMGFMNAVLAVTDPGDEVILQLPYYFNHEMAVRIAGALPVLVPTDSQYQLDLDGIRSAITSRTRAIVTVSPNNPTGAVYPEAALRAVNALCQGHGLYHIHDEAYEYFVYPPSDPSEPVPGHFSPASIPNSALHTISLFSMSKAYGFASWRIGWMVAPQHLVPSIRKIQDTNVICPPVISQYAAIGALEAGWSYCAQFLPGLGEVRRLFLNELDAIRDFCTVPFAGGAFYFLLRLDTRIPALMLVERLIREHGVAAIPGDAFGATEGCYLRVAYGALQKQTAAEGIHRLIHGLRTILHA